MFLILSYFFRYYPPFKSRFGDTALSLSVLYFLRCVCSTSQLILAAGLRSRSPENKALIVSEVEKNVWPAIAAGKIKPVVYKYFPLGEAVEAHQLIESSKHIGKIVLLVS